jgi:hypothetical protein
VSGIRGEAPPEKYKVALSYADGYRAVGRMLVSGPQTLVKAAKASEIFWDRAGGADLYERSMTQFVGWDASHPTLATEEPSELLLQVSVRDHDRRKIETSFAPMVVGSMLGSIPGFTMPGDQGRPRVSDVVAHWPALISRDQVRSEVVLGDRREVVSSELPAGSPGAAFEAAPAATASTGSDGPHVTVPLLRLCLARSGDKGDTSNVGVIARSPEVYAWMVEHLTESVVKQHFKGVCQGSVDRFELPNLQALNFLLHESLGGGGTQSLQFDAQGKTYSQYLLSLQVDVPESLLASVG